MFRRKRDISPSLRGILKALVIHCRMNGFGSEKHGYVAKGRIEPRAPS
jgi:hypothetical protein